MDDLRKAAGPKPKASQDAFEKLEAKVAALETVLARMAHNSGTPNTILMDAGLTPYTLKPKDTRKYAS